MRTYAYLLMFIASLMMLSAGVKIIQTAWEWVITLLLGMIVFYCGVLMYPRRYIKNKQNLNLTQDE